MNVHECSRFISFNAIALIFRISQDSTYLFTTRRKSILVTPYKWPLKNEPFVYRDGVFATDIADSIDCDGRFCLIRCTALNCCAIL